MPDVEFVELDIVSIIQNEMFSDDCNESEEILEFYNKCDEKEKTAINKFCTYLCGWSMETVIKKAKESA